MDLRKFKFKKKKNENWKKRENCTVLIPKGNSYCRRKSSARGPWFRVSSKGLSTEIYMLIRSSIKILTEAHVAEPYCTRQVSVGVY